MSPNVNSEPHHRTRILVSLVFFYFLCQSVLDPSGWPSGQPLKGRSLIYR